MRDICARPCEWVEEVTTQLAQDSLRTLVFGVRELSLLEWEQHKSRLEAAANAVHNRAGLMAEARAELEHGLEAICVTGVEDRLQDSVPIVLE